MKTLLANRMDGISSFYVMELLQRAKQLEKQGVDVIHMEIGEPDFPTSGRIIKAAIDNLKTGSIKYTPAGGLPELRQKIAHYYRHKYGVSIDPARIFITPGASGAFLLALGVSLNPAEEILMSDPCYPCNRNFVKLFEGFTKTIPVDASTDFQLTAQLIKNHWTSMTKGVFIASPSNPTGTLINPDALAEAVKVVRDMNGCFYSDEIYHGLVYDLEDVTALQFSDDVFVINSFSKYFGMTGWRIGWLIVPEEFIQAVEKLAQNIFIATATHSQYAALAALEPSTLLELEDRRREFESRRDFLYDHLQRLGFKVAVKPQGAFYIYADCSQLTEDSFQFTQDLLEIEGVAITPGIDFGRHHANHFVRFAYTTSIDRMQKAIERLEHFLSHS